MLTFRSKKSSINSLFEVQGFNIWPTESGLWVFQTMVLRDGVRMSKVKINQIAHHLCWLFRLR